MRTSTGMMMIRWGIDPEGGLEGGNCGIGGWDVFYESRSWRVRGWEGNTCSAA